MIGPAPGQWAASAACWLSLVPIGARWLRVAQREHYLPGAAVRFAKRWWVGVRANVPLLVLGAACAGVSWWVPLVALGSAGLAFGPRGLPVRGRSSPLGLTRRLRTLAATWAAFEAGIVSAGAATGRPAFASAVALVLAPAVVDLACLATAPLERHLASRHVERAAQRLRSVRPTIVGITGSYGKTSTKNYVAHLVRTTRSVVASPASFNNRAGLARAVNEHLADGTEVFVAEMGTYGRGEIAELCQWCPPEISVLTAIGPVHLERFGSEDAIVEAKSEITETASVVVLNADDQRLAKLAGELEASRHLTVVRCSSTERGADVYVGSGPTGLEVRIAGVAVQPDGPLPPGVHPTNLACALGVAVQLGVAPEVLRHRLADLPTVPHRVAVATSPAGVRVIDDTFNSNPAGARAALELLQASPGGGRRVVVTPGMIELGARQYEENRRFAQAVVERGFDLVVVGWTNRAALLSGARGAGVLSVRTREEAVRWVRQHLSAGDAVLYENDLPDHYP